MDLINIVSRWSHLLFGIAWIGILYYFNFIQGGYFKAATPEGLADAKAKLAPSALWWFRWAAMFTFITGLILLAGVIMSSQLNSYIVMGATLGTLMFLNVWLVIWPNQKIALGMVEGDGPAAAGKALLASRTNVLFSGPMAFGMLGGAHFAGSGVGYGSALGTGLWVTLAIIAALEINALKGKQGPMTTVNGVIGSSVVLTVIMVAALILIK
ncbi:MAG: urate hydroxylase PuuD [Gammaproteobacteria bacterium]|nr:urate hydroxylase PuuD [Gammaproteobacteria bacterium]